MTVNLISITYKISLALHEAMKNRDTINVQVSLVHEISHMRQRTLTFWGLRWGTGQSLC